MELVRETELEGIAIQRGDEYSFPCPCCGEEVDIDDFGPAYRCRECNSVVRFREENIIVEDEKAEKFTYDELLLIYDALKKMPKGLSIRFDHRAPVSVPELMEKVGRMGDRAEREQREGAE